MDCVSVFLVFLLAYILRFNFDIQDINYRIAFHQSLIAVFVYALYSILFRSYSGLLRHTTLTDISLVFIVTTFSAITLLALTLLSRTLFWGPTFTMPISIILIHFGTISIFLFFVRVLIKIIFRFATATGKMAKRVIIYGAGELGFIVKRVIVSDPDNGYNVVCFIDDDKNLFGKKINRIPVYSFNILTREFVTKNKIDSLIFALKNITLERKSRVIRLAISLGIEVLETPEVEKWLNGQLHPNQFRKVKLEDLLGREPIQLNLHLIRCGLNDKTILVTGAAGSIGSEIVRQLARFNSEKVILVDQAETPLFYLENEIKEKLKDLEFRIIMADVTSREKMEIIYRDFRPDIVFHAAAYKHVPLLEDNPHESVRVNVGGTRILTDLAIHYKVGKFVMISTDKSVNPMSVMGASKRICEKIVQSESQKVNCKTQFIITRFGNVLGSNGSVIPIFSQQIANGGPVTVTHPEVQRYFMTIPEACQLVLEAGFMGHGSEIFVFDMGKPVKIADLAVNMIRLSGLEPDKDIPIVYTGLRPGEKLFEELLTDKEITLETHHPKIRKAKVEEIDGTAYLLKVDQLLANLYTLTRKEIVKEIGGLVPEYRSSNEEYTGHII